MRDEEGAVGLMKGRAMTLGHGDVQGTDLAMVVMAVAVNLLVAVMFLGRVRGTRRANLWGWVAVALAVPVAAIAIWNLVGGRAWWTIVLPALYAAYALLELLLDGILKVDFRSSWLLAPYLVTYYVGLLGLVGYAFGVGAIEGFVSLAAYFLSLAATSYSYRRVGHGVATASQIEHAGSGR